MNLLATVLVFAIVIYFQVSQLSVMCKLQFGCFCILLLMHQSHPC